MISGLIRKKLGRITKNVLMRVQVRTRSRKTAQADGSVAKTNAAKLPKMAFFRRLAQHTEKKSSIAAKASGRTYRMASCPANSRKQY